MKRIALATVALLVIASTASAQNWTNSLSLADEQEIRMYVPNADLGNLTTDQVGRLQLTLHGGDGAGRGGFIRSILD